jgi:hypothetical protein
MTSTFPTFWSKLLIDCHIHRKTNYLQVNIQGEKNQKKNRQKHIKQKE